MFIEIPASRLQSGATESNRMPKLYYHPNWFARKFFWERLRVLHRFLLQYPVRRDSCLDFGCGSGVFLPTLASEFKSVTGVDIETAEASKILAHYNPSNVSLVDADIYTTTAFGPGMFDVVMAPDVLEHFKDLETPVARIRTWLKSDGFLFTSLPTENAFTRATRIAGKYTKPWDHYHTGYEVEEFLAANGFRRIRRSLLFPFFPLYLTSVWRKA
jgi:2-polyprenyl-3-methyl-5-hydroxy-6-metoxy-1,4-benzoquinol methylase